MTEAVGVVTIMSHMRFQILKRHERAELSAAERFLKIFFDKQNINLTTQELKSPLRVQVVRRKQRRLPERRGHHLVAPP